MVTPSALLSDVARHLVVPEGITGSVFPRVEHRLQQVGVEFDLWQRGFGAVALGVRDDGIYAASIGGVTASICRQTGKTFTVGNLVIGLCLEFPGLRAVWTSHHNRTTTNTFRSMQTLVRRPGIAAQLAPNGIRVANGEQEIRFRNGSIIMFGAREQGFGRGLDEVDVEVFDEAQILTIKALEDMVPATNQARHEHGGLIFFLGTPPRPTDSGEAFMSKRQRALDGETLDQVYVEFSADPEANSDDRSEWPVMNPSYPKRTPMESMLRMRENIPDDDSWRREAMGIWPRRTTHVSVIKPTTWRNLKARGPDLDALPDAFGVDMSHGLEISVHGCWMREVTAHVQELWAGSDVGAAVEWIAAHAGYRVEVVIDDVSPASQMIPELQARRVKTRRSTARDMAKGCLMFETRTNSGQLTHRGHRRLTDAVMGARKRAISDAGGWGWDRRDSSVQIHPVVAATLALLGATSKPVKRDRSTSGRRGIVM